MSDAPDGLVLLDPHAAHERVGYERIRAAAGGGGVQPLLIPVPLPPTLALEAEEHRETLVRFGFELEDCDGGTRLRSVPSVGGAVEPEALLRGSLGALKEDRDGDAAELLWRTWATIYNLNSVFVFFIPVVVNSWSFMFCFMCANGSSAIFDHFL